MSRSSKSKIGLCEVILYIVLLIFLIGLSERYATHGQLTESIRTVVIGGLQTGLDFVFYGLLAPILQFLADFVVHMFNVFIPILGPILVIGLLFWMFKDLSNFGKKKGGGGGHH